MQGVMPMDKNLIDAVNAVIGQRMSAVNPEHIGSFTPQMGNQEVAPPKPQTQRKLPQDVMDRIIKTRIYEMDPKSSLSPEDINLIDTAVYR